jgi:hypothetical protein
MKQPLIKLNGWQTIKDYCQEHGIKSTSVVSNWIKRPNPKIGFIRVKELNNLLLVKQKI